MNLSQKAVNYFLLFLALSVIAVGTTQRLDLALKSKGSGDYPAQINAITDLFSGTNPYLRTIETYNNLDSDPGNKGYAYLPGIMYTNSVLYLLSIVSPTFKMPSLMHIPGILAGVGIGLFFIKTLYKKNNLAMLFAISFWMFNPYFYLKNSLEGYDVVTICLVLWALYFLKKDDVISGVLFTLSVVFKTYPIFLGLVFLLSAKNKKNIVLAGLIIFVLFSIPFLSDIQNFITYMQGSLFVHGDRFVQGRPYLHYASYLWDIQLIQMIPFVFYSLTAVISGWLISIVIYFSKIIKNKYSFAIFPYLTFYFFTPVLNRTYLLWAIPVFLIGTFKLFEKRYRFLFYILNIFYWFFCYWYLAQWKDGFHIHARL